jgi:hypothetical protein
MMLNGLRKINPHRKHHSKRVGSVVIHSWFKYVQEPDSDEFDEIYHVQPVLSYENEAEKKFLKNII